VSILIHVAVHVARAIAEQRKRAAEAAAARATRRPRHDAPFQPAPRERALFLDAKWEPADGASVVRLSVRGGQAWLVLCDAESDGTSTDGWSDAVIEARDRARRAAFVKAIAAWLDVPAPVPAPTPAAELAPFALRWSRVEEVDGVERLALRFEWKDRTAEVLLHSRKGPMVKLAEKDPAMRADLVAILAVALRDGAPR